MLVVKLVFTGQPVQSSYKEVSYQFPEVAEQISGRGKVQGRAGKIGGLYQLEQIWNCLVRDKIQYRNRKSQGLFLSPRLIAVGLAVHPCC